MNYDSPTEINKVLADAGLALKKRFGQNFLVNRYARERLAGLLESGPDDLVWEIGPGLGAMTGLLLDHARLVAAFEIDHGLARLLKGYYSDRPSLVILEGDALDTMGQARERYGKPDRLLGNLPYSSASKLIAYFIEEDLAPAKSVVTVQKDLALRMKAGPGEKIYSSFSVFVQSFFDVRIEFELKGGNFHPRPEVESSAVSLRPHDRLPKGAGRQAFFKLIRLAFGSRRKTLNNNLLKSERYEEDEKAILRDFWSRLGLKENNRAEDLAPEVYLDIAAALATAQHPAENLEKKPRINTDENG